MPENASDCATNTSFRINAIIYSLIILSFDTIQSQLTASVSEAQINKEMNWCNRLAYMAVMNDV
jgi:hypothetical protein